MPVKAYGPADDPAWVRWSGGLTWLAHPVERMRRASHAIAVDGPPTGNATGVDDPVVVVEPLDAPGLDDRLDGLGTVAAVAVLSDYHRRDAAAVARRHDVPVVLPGTLAGLASGIDAPVEQFEGSLGETGFRAVELFDGPLWREAALYRPADGTLLTAETLVTSSDLKRPGERLAVIPYVRVFPPRDALGGLDVERVLVGHGQPVLDDAAGALAKALADARRGAPAAVLGNLPYLLRASAVAVRD